MIAEERVSFSDKLPVLINSLKDWVSDTKLKVTKALQGLKDMFPKEAEYKGQKVYSCGIEDCKLCFESRTNGLQHVVRCHMLKSTTMKERFDLFPDSDGALRLALCGDFDEDESQGAQVLRSMAISYVEAMTSQPE